MYYELRVMPTSSKCAWLYSFTPLGGLSMRQYIGTGKPPPCGTKENDAPTTYPATPFNKESASKTKRTAKSLTCRWKFESRRWLTSLHCLVQLPTSVCILHGHRRHRTGQVGKGERRRLCPLCYESEGLLPPLPLFPHATDLDTLSSHV